MGRALELGQVFAYGGLQDRVCGIDVPVGEVVAHAGDLPPRIDGCVASVIFPPC